MFATGGIHPEALMRITGGIWRGRRFPIVVPAGVRPTMDRVRKALFDRLQGMIALQGIIVADLFAGTGTLGIEALSRGATYCIFVERNRRLTEFLHCVLSLLTLNPRHYRIITGDVFRVLRYWEELDLPRPHLLFADPPYQSLLGNRLLRALAESHWLRPGALLCLELSRWETVAHAPAGWQLHSERLFGETRLQWWYWHGTDNATSTLPGDL